VSETTTTTITITIEDYQTMLEALSNENAALRRQMLVAETIVARLNGEVSHLRGVVAFVSQQAQVMSEQAQAVAEAHAERVSEVMTAESHPALFVPAPDGWVGGEVVIPEAVVQVTIPEAL
jgi:hypothetical protein